MMGRFLMLLMAAWLLSGCFFKSDLKKCHKPQEYQQAKPGPRARVPDDLQPLPSEARLKVPYGVTQSEPLPKDEPCLTEAPSFEERGVN